MIYKIISMFFFLSTQLYGSQNIAISFNMGTPPMLGCRLSPNVSKIDCNDHKIGVAPFYGSPSVYSALQAIKLGESKSDLGSKNKVYYTQFHVNGYWASIDPVITFFRFDTVKPLKLSGGATAMPSGFDSHQYLYTLVDFILMSQNVMGVQSDIKAFKSGTSFGGYNCGVGNLLGGLLLGVTMQQGLTDIVNYMFDCCVLYGNRNPSLYQNKDVVIATTSNSTGITATFDLTSTFTGAYVDITYNTFTTIINNEIPSNITLSTSDYFNGCADPSLAIGVYLPLHFSDPGTGYFGGL